MKWLLAFVIVIGVYTVTPTVKKVEFICTTFDGVVRFGAWGVDAATELNSNLNMSSNGVVDQEGVSSYMVKASVACREKVRRIALYTDGLELLRYKSHIEDSVQKAMSK